MRVDRAAVARHEYLVILQERYFIMQIIVALLQTTSSGNDQAANLSKVETFCRLAHDMGADITLFPEMWAGS